MFVTKASRQLHLSETLWRGSQPSWLLQCDKLQLVVTKHGLNIASVTHQDDDKQINPLWVPNWPWTSPEECRHLHIDGELEKLYGNREDSQLLANLCGHSLCMDRFGLCKLADEPRTCHGEAPVSRWDIAECTNDMVAFSVYLPLARLHIKRSFNIEDDVLYVTTWVNNASNKCMDFFQQNVQQSQNSDDDSWSFTMNEMTQNIAQQRNIGAHGNVDMSTASLLNLPNSKKQRQQTRVRRDQSQLQRTYDVARSYMEEQYRDQVLGKTSEKVKELFLSPRALWNQFRTKNKTYNSDDIVPPDTDAGVHEERSVFQKIFGKMIMNPLESARHAVPLKFASDDRSRFDVEWAEHIVLGDPFLTGAEYILPQTIAEANIAYNCPLAMEHSRFDGEPAVALDKALEMPAENDVSTKVSEATACFVGSENDSKSDSDMHVTNFIVRNASLGMELEYEWNGKAWPWLCIWTEHHGTDIVPWNGQQRCRGLELSTKPFPIPSLHAELQKIPNAQITSDNDEPNLRLWNDKPIDFVLPPEGRVETFALRWSPIKPA